MKTSSETWLRYRSELRQDWLKEPSPLKEQWYMKYERTEEGTHGGWPGTGIFEPYHINEVRRPVLRDQGRAHFGEWFTAIHYYDLGYQVLVEKYCFEKKHTKMFARASAVLGSDVLTNLISLRLGQLPDLLVYRNDKGQLDRFFVEVKRPKEGYTTGQAKLFPHIEDKLRIPITTVRLATDAELEHVLAKAHVAN